MRTNSVPVLNGMFQRAAAVGHGPRPHRDVTVRGQPGMHGARRQRLAWASAFHWALRHSFDASESRMQAH